MAEIPVLNPRTGEISFTFSAADPHAVAQAAQANRAAQPVWAACTPEQRCAVLLRWREALQVVQQDLTAALAEDTGRRLLAQAEVQGVLARIGHWCERAPQLLEPLPEGISQAAASVRFAHQRVPYPLVGVISPWNFPLTLGLIDAVPALLAGCSVLLKPSEVTPRFVAPLQRAIDAVPELAAVFRIVLGDATTGIALIDQVDAVCFTGSVVTGRKVAMQCAARLIPAFLELGGKDPAIVLASADLGAAADGILRSAAAASGQACMSIERVYVEQAAYVAFLDALLARAKAIELTHPDPKKGHLGPLIFAPQAETIQRQLQDACDKGARILSGGNLERLDGGSWYRPTIVVDVSDDMLLMQEETFGPIIPVIAVGSAEEAIQRANASEFGLSAAVFAASEAEARSVAEQINAGAVSINDAGLTAMVHDVEKNSFGHSGLGGSRMGDAGLLRFFRKKALLIQTAPPSALTLLDEAYAAW